MAERQRSVRRLDGDFGDDGGETSIWKKEESGNKYNITFTYVYERDRRQRDVDPVCVRARTRASARNDQVCVFSVCVHVCMCVCSAAVLRDGNNNSGAKMTTARTRVFFQLYIY